ncbi:hypothetical protein DN602_01975 [Raoultella ornithinolytica]|nr:hypothetical protein DN602_01975 [Raoultella ornithinolytica]
MKFMQLHVVSCIALNDKTKSTPATRITIAIIINFIYYRHSVLNVCLPLFQPDASHSVFFYPSLHNFNYPAISTEKNNGY